MSDMKSKKRYLGMVATLVAMVVVAASCTKLEAENAKTGIVNPTKVVK